ncbi:hypothetical protein SAY86_020416 [Trapa natans]|uniref:Uncharacterized protein n=1 Tax=Trapa natans TaxID=22666 RepID=A0AAN7LZB6_TRANT|nr:hypothetical protein SAY86_020416 [Trapa natans]
MENLKEDRPRCFSISLPHGQPSKKKGKDASQSLPHGQARERRVRDGSQSLPHPFTTSSQYMDVLTSYEAACQVDPDLHAFDHPLHNCTNRVINSLFEGIEVRSLSFGSLSEVAGSLLQMDQEVVKVVLECKKDIRNSHQMFALLDDYFEYSMQTLDICTSLETCLEKARDSQSIIQLAIKYFDEESRMVDNTEGKRYVKTLQELGRFRAAGNPFTNEFFVLFESIYKQQLVMLEKLQVRNTRFGKKIKLAKVWTRASNIILGAAVVSALIFSVVAAAMAAPPVIIALATILPTPLGYVRKWCNSLLKKRRGMLMGQRGLVSSMQVGTYVVIKDMDNILQLVNTLESQIRAMVEAARVPRGADDVEMELSIVKIKKRLALSMEMVEELGKATGKCCREIRKARMVVVQEVIKRPNN